MAGGARRGRGMITDINVTTLVDIMLVLLIIFMLTANLIAKQAIEVDLPKAAQGGALDNKPIGVTLTKTGEMFVEGVPQTPEELKALVKAAVQKNPKTVVMIAADKQTAHGRVVWVIDAVKGLGVASFAIQIDPASLQPPPVK
ncbi:MAG: biopolymer transporter ExbD [Deltaproteobacteria bacterium]|nr:biopolymer transporter ExbD [Deltaproteobacteria bacterium]